MNENNIKKILSDLERGYDLVANKFSGTRSFMWRDLGFIRDMVRRGDKVLDFGCGNGRLAGYFDNNYQEYVGVDISRKLIGLAKQKYSSEKTKFIKVSPQVIRLPFEDNYFDAIFSIAVFHHFPSKEYMLRIAKELHRVLAPGGKIVIAVWNLWQRRFWKYHLEAIKNKLLGRSELDWGDLYVPFRSGEKVFERYHHAFREGEMAGLFNETGFKMTDFKKGCNLIYAGEK